MKKVVIESFEGEQVYTFIWNGKPCWIASSVLSIFGYSDTSKPIIECIEKEDFEEGIEFEFITGEALKNFKRVVCETIPTLKYAARLIIFYEKGLYGFLQFSGKPKAIEFKKWLRREVIPAIKEDGVYTLDPLEASKEDNKNIGNNSDKLDVVLDTNTKKMINKLRDTISNESGFDVDKFQRIRTTLEMIKLFKVMLDEMTDDVSYKFEFLKAICTEAGMALPIFAEGDDVI